MSTTVSLSLIFLSSDGCCRRRLQLSLGLHSPSPVTTTAGYSLLSLPLSSAAVGRLISLCPRFPASSLFLTHRRLHLSLVSSISSLFLVFLFSAKSLPSPSDGRHRICTSRSVTFTILPSAVFSLFCVCPSLFQISLPISFSVLSSVSCSLVVTPPQSTTSLVAAACTSRLFVLRKSITVGCRSATPSVASSLDRHHRLSTHCVLLLFCPTLSFSAAAASTSMPQI